MLDDCWRDSWRKVIGGRKNSPISRMPKTLHKPGNSRLYLSINPLKPSTRWPTKKGMPCIQSILKFCELACFFASGTLPTACWMFGTVPRPTEDCTPERLIWSSRSRQSIPTKLGVRVVVPLKKKNENEGNVPLKKNYLNRKYTSSNPIDFQVDILVFREVLLEIAPWEKSDPWLTCRSQIMTEMQPANLAISSKPGKP